MNDVNSYNEGGRTPLMEAVYSHDIARVEELLRNGADPSIKDENFGTSTALDIAQREFSKHQSIDLKRIISLLDGNNESGAEQFQKLEESRKKLDECREEIASSKMELLSSRVSSGLDVFLYKSVRIPVNSILDECDYEEDPASLVERLYQELTMPSLGWLGLEGWEVTGVVPQTRGRALVNHEGGGHMTWGGGIGGAVVAAHVILRMKLGSENFDENFIRSHILENLDSYLTMDEQQKMTQLSESLKSLS